MIHKVILRKADTLFRKYHRQLSILTLLPIFLITVTGIAIPIADELKFEGLAKFMTQVHSGAFFGSDLAYSVLSGLGLLGLLVTGVTMTGLLPKKRLVSDDFDL